MSSISIALAVRLFSNNEQRADDLVRPATKREGINISLSGPPPLLSSARVSLLRVDEM